MRDRPPWLIPDAMRTRYFVGRDDLLERLRQQLLERHRAALFGLGGVGKTQTALEYAVRHRTEYRGGTFWITAETVIGLVSGFVEIAKTLCLAAATSNDEQHVVRAVLEWLNTTAGWLLIIDNVEDRREVAALVPATSTGDVLITSRESVFTELGIPRGIEVRELGCEQAVHFLFTRTGRQDAAANERAAATELAATLGNLPLALEQAAAYITETNADFCDYLSAFGKRRMALLEKAVGLVSHDSVAVTWAANVEAVECASPAAADVLRISAFLAPDAIPFELFSIGGSALGGAIAEAVTDADALTMNEVLRPLARYSLIRADATTRTFSVHRLVQEVVRAAIRESDARTYVQRAVSALEAAFPDAEYATWTQCERLILHVAPLADWALAHELFTQSASRILNLAGVYLTARGRYAEAATLLEHAVAIWQRAAESEHLEVASSLGNLAIVYWNQSRLSEAQLLCERALAIRERALSSDHPDIAASLTILANVHLSRGQPGEAQPMFERALAIRECALGSVHLDVAVSLSNLAKMEFTRGEYAASEMLFERVLAIRERLLGPGHPDVGTSLSNLASVLYTRGRYAMAQPLYERALALRERVLGLEHPEVADSLNNLANVHWSLGDYATAEPLYEGALRSYERIYGPHHPKIAFCFNNLVDLHCSRGRYDEAEALSKRALAIYERALGDDHPDLARTLDNLASIHREQGRYTSAEALYARALAIRERAFGPDYSELGESLDGLAGLNFKQGRFADAESLYERALAIAERAFGPNHPDVARALVGMASLRRHQRRDAEAITILERAHNIKERMFAPKHPELQVICETLDALRAGTCHASPPEASSV